MNKNNLTKKSLMPIFMLSVAFVSATFLASSTLSVAKAASDVLDIDPETYRYEKSTSYRNDKVFSSDECTYYENGSLKSKAEYEVDDTTKELAIFEKFEYTYNESGLVSRNMRTDYSNGEVTNISVIDYEYNEHGDKTISTLANIIDGQYVLDHKNYDFYEYDAQGRMTSHIQTFNDTKDPYMKELFEYYDGGYFRDSYSYVINTWFYGSSTEFVLNAKGVVTASYTVEQDHTNRSSAHTFEFDAKDRLVKDVIHGQDNILVQAEHTYTYLKDTNFVKESTQTYFNNDSSIRNHNIAECIYDSLDRITSCNKTYKKPNSQTGQLEVSSTESVKFTYKNNPATQSAGLSGGAVAGIVIGILFLLLLICYLIGYFFYYRKGKLDDRKIRVIYKFLPRGDKNKE